VDAIALREVDLEPDLGGVQRIELPIGAEPFWVFAARPLPNPSASVGLGETGGGDGGGAGSGSGEDSAEPVAPCGCSRGRAPGSNSGDGGTGGDDGAGDVGPGEGLPFIVPKLDNLQFAYVSDALSDGYRAQVYILDINPESDTYNQHVQTITVSPAPLGLRGLTVSADGLRLYVAAPGKSLFSRSAPVAGNVLVIDLDPSSPTFHEQIGTIPVGPEPYGITATTNSDVILVTDRTADAQGMGMIRRTPGGEAGAESWSVTYTNLLELGRDPAKRYYQTFGVSNAEGVAYLPENALAAVIGPHPAYAFVTGFNRLIAGDPKHDPNFDPIAGAGCIDYAGGCAAASGPAQSATGEVSPLYIRQSSGNILVTRQDGLRTPGVAQIAGGNVAIIRDPLGDPTFEGVGLVAGTRNTPNSFPDNLVLSGQFLLAGYRGNDAVMAFSAAEIVKTIESIVARQGAVDFNLADLHTRAIDDLQPQVDTRAEFQFFQFVADETGQPLGYLDPQAPATQLIGLDGSSQSINALDPSFSLALYFTSIPSSPRSPIGVGGTPQGLAAQPEVDGVAIDPRTNPYNLKNGMCEAGVCADFAAFAHTTSEVELHSGAVHERHAVPTYTAFGATRGLVLHYDSLRADPRPIVHFGFDNVSEALGGNSRILTARITAQGVDTDVHAFTVPAAGGRAEAALQLDMSRHPSGVYPYQLQTSLSSGSAAAQHDQVVVVNGIASPFGAGWNLEELYEIVVNDDGSALLISGDGSETTFQPPRDGSGLYVSPAGDYSELRLTAAGTFERTMKDGTVYRFNVYHRLASVTDRSGNTVQYLYDDYCRLIEVIDPAGLSTTLAYSGDRVASMTDPFGRTTRFGYDTRGNLTRITDPDGTQRSFRYDDLHHLTGETTKRGFEETIEYDFAGRAVRATRADGGVIDVSAAQTNGLYSPDQTKPGSDSPPPARDLGSPEGRVVQPNGEAVSTRVGQTGTATAGRDAIGPTSTAQRDASGRVTQVTDALQRSQVFSYDAQGNRTAVTDDVGRSETAYDPQFSQVTGETDSLGRQIRYGLDPETGRILTRTQVVGEFGGTDDVVSQYTYLAHGLLDRVTDPLGHVTDYDYDARGRVTAITFAAGTAVAAVRRYEYDAPGNVTAVIDENGQRTEYEYDVMNRRTLTRDPLGNVTRFEYDAAGNLSEETDARGHATAYEYDGANRRTQVVDALGNVGAFRFDHQGNLVEATGPLQQRETTEYDARNRPIVTRDALGHATTYTYDADDNLIALTDPNGNTTRYEYDGRNRLVKVTNALGGTKTFTYDAANQRRSETDEAGRTTRYAYDDLGRLVTSTDPLGGVVRNAYDAAGNLSSVTDALGRTTTYTYDARNRRTQIEDALGNRTTFQYDAVGNQTAIQDALGRSVQFTYDVLNRVLRETDALGNVTVYGYDAVGNQTRVTDALGRVTTYAYDALDRRTSRTDAVGGVAVWTYDDAGRLVAERDELGRTVAHAYDNLGREISRTEPGDRTTTFEYDSLGNLLRMTDPLGQFTRYAYDALNRRIGVTDAAGATTRYAFDAVGNVLSVTDPLGNETSYAYDALDRTITETNEVGGVRRYSYDAVGNLISQVDRNGRERQFTYDALDRRIEERWLGAAPRTITTAYDAVGQVTVAADVDSRYVYTYDAIGRLTGASNSGTPGVPTVAMAYTFDAVDNLLTRTDTIDGTAAGTTAYVYDSLNRVQRITQSGPTVSDKRVDLAYNAASDPTSLDRYSDLAGTQRVLSSFFSYDAAGRLATLEHTRAAVAGGAGSVAQYAYTYDAVNRITQIVAADGTAGYTYDTTGQLIAVDNTTLPDEAYTYDVNGNRIGAGYSTGANNRLVSDGTYQYTYDAEGNRLRRTHIASGEVTEYTWDHRNRLTRVAVKSSGGIIIKDSAYTYDVLNRRIATSVDADGAGAGAAVSERMVYDDQNLALVFDGAGARTQRYLYGPQIDQVLADERAAGPVYWTLGDQQGSVRDIADSTGMLRNHLVYDAFGKILSESNPAISHRFAFTGREFDSATGLYYYRARYYDAPLGLFLSEDPRGFNAGPANFYTYVGNSPLNATDPLGEEAWIAAQTPYSPEEAARSAQLARRLGNLAFVTASAAAAGALAAPVFAAGFGLAGGAAVGLLGETIGGGLAGGLALGFGIVGAKETWDHFYNTLTDPNLDRLQRLERLLPGLAATISGGIVGRRLCGLSESAFELGYGIGAAPKDFLVKDAKKTLLRWFGPVSSATPEQVAAIERLAAKEGYEIAIRDSDRLTACVTKKLSTWGFEAKPEHIKAKSFFGIVYDRQSGKWYRSDLDIAWVRKGGQIIDNKTQLDEIIPTLNRYLRKPGTGPEQTDTFLHGSHATALNNFGGGPVTDVTKYRTFADPGGGPVTVFTGGGQSQLNGTQNKLRVWQYFTEHAWKSLLADDVRIADATTVAATLPGVLPLAAAARDLWNQSMAGASVPEVAVSVADLPGALLAQARLLGAGGIADAPFAEVVVDADAAGRGWFVDPTPMEHAEFTAALSGESYTALPGLDAAGRYDLLTVLAHELGHVLGFAGDHEHLDADEFPDDLMTASLPPGTRRLPSAVDAAIVAAAMLAGSPAGEGEGEPAAAIVNGDFAISDPLATGFGWTTLGAVAVVEQRAELSESAAAFARLSQTFTVPAAGSSLSLALHELSFGGGGIVPDALEVKLVDAATGQSLVPTPPDVEDTDSLLIVQSTGEVYFGAGTSVPGATASGDTVSLTLPLTVTVDISGVPAGTLAALHFVLLGFAPYAGRVTIDDVAIAADVAPTLQLDPAFDTGLPGDNLTRLATVDLIGTASPAAQLQLDRDGAGFDDGSAQATGGGQFRFFSVPLAEGSNTLRVQSATGREAESVVILDTQLPAGTLVTPAAGATTRQRLGYGGVQWADPGAAGLDAATFDAADVTITGVTVDRSEDRGGGLVRYWYDGGGEQLPQGPIGVALVAGVVADRAGNSDAGAQFDFTVDTFPPAAPVITGITDDTGTDAGDGVTSDATLIVSGTAEAGSSVEVSRNGTSVGATAANDSGAWSLDGTATILAPGTYDFTALARDLAGNVSLVSATFRVVVVSWQNPRSRFDVNGDGRIQPVDVLILINDINARQSRPLPLPPPPNEFPPPFLDTNGDGSLTPADVLEVINYLNSHSSSQAAAGAEFTAASEVIPEGETEELADAISAIAAAVATATLRK